MKHLYIFVTIIFLIFAIPINVEGQASCTTECYHAAEGCEVTFRQAITSWSMMVECQDGYTNSDFGSGDYEGTLCGGVEPCSLPSSV